MHARLAVPLCAAALLALLTVALLWPGVATFDTVAQWTQATTGQYDDWHPPVMARLWSLLLRAGIGGTGPLLLLQLAMAWAGAGLLAAALARAGAPRAAAAVLLVPLFPPLASWMACVLKDCQLVGALLLATGLVGWFRLHGARVPVWAAALAALLLGYATLLRANAAFSTVPLALGWAGWGARRWPGRAALVVAGCVAAIAVSGPINHGPLGAERSEVERTLPLFDMAGTAHFAHLPTLPQLPAPVWAAAERTGCYTPFFWDALGDRARCAGGIATRLAFDRDEDAPSIFRDWIGLIARHPVAYLEHRIAHLNATFRVAAPADERLADGPATSLLNPHRLGEPARAAAARLAPVAAWVAASPAGSPAVWLAVALALAWVLRETPVQPARALAAALLASALVQWASFAVVSIASDLRYHLWPIAATLLAACLLGGCQGVSAARLRGAAGLVLLAAFGSALLRHAVQGELG